MSLNFSENRRRANSSVSCCFNSKGGIAVPTDTILGIALTSIMTLSIKSVRSGKFMHGKVKATVQLVREIGIDP